MSAETSKTDISPTRLEAFSDGVIATIVAAKYVLPYACIEEQVGE